MGSSTYFATNGLTKREMVDFLFQQFPDHVKLLRCSFVGNVAYCAVELTKIKQVFGLVIKFSKDHGDWNIREISEDMGPVDADCPACILDLLTPTDSDYANGWRQRCRESIANKKSKPAVGQKIRFDRPIRFTDGHDCDTFEVVRFPHGRRNLTAYRSLDNGRPYRITRIQNRKFEIV